MKRQWHTARIPELDGSDRSMQLAAAIAQVSDPQTLEALLQGLTLLDRVGGQLYIAAYRTKYKTEQDPSTGEFRRLPVRDVREPGSYETDGLVFHYEHIAKITRQDPEPDAALSDAEANNGVVPEEDLAGAASDTAESVQADQE
jgi:hypothetical protein